ncbi:MAG: cysteine desulfurase family protein [Bacilli bacterium]|nr:cysteine desulfurase family protein [Bacilli bacterium]
MIYLDYSATTPVDNDVLNAFCEASRSLVGNANSLHELGIKCQSRILQDSKDILKNLGLDDKQYEIIYTSGASEANNLAIKGYLERFGTDKHIITTNFEHPSVTAPVGYLQNKGYQIDFVKTNKKGLVDLVDLEKLITDKTILVSIVSVNSEIGIKQPISEIAMLLKKYPQIVFHSDITQSIGKAHEVCTNIDMMSFSAHKFYGVKGVGALIKKKEIKLIPQIHGGTSTSKYRSGTPFHPLVSSMAYALQLATESFNARYQKTKVTHDYFVKELSRIPQVRINSNEYAIPHIVNLSIIGKNSIEIVEYMSKKGIYISNHTACSSKQQMSLAVYNLTEDKGLALSSVRVSLSHLTTFADIDALINAIKEMVN